jgi:S-formylglutathione hydrolase FrmB
LRATSVATRKIGRQASFSTAVLTPTLYSVQEYDATSLILQFDGPKDKILIDQGTADEFLKKQQLLPDDFAAAAKQVDHPVQIKMREGYDHSYYYIVGSNMVEMTSEEIILDRLRSLTSTYRTIPSPSPTQRTRVGNQPN